MVFAYTVVIFKADFPFTSIESKIVGGFDTETPIQYQIGVFWKVTNIHICGATLLNRRHVLSAAHCMKIGNKKIDDIILHAGTYNKHNKAQVV
jgi:secreted trypsin-like serine protease